MRAAILLGAATLLLAGGCTPWSTLASVDQYCAHADSGICGPVDHFYPTGDPGTNLAILGLTAVDATTVAGVGLFNGTASFTGVISGQGGSVSGLSSGGQGALILGGRRGGDGRAEGL